MIKDNVKAIETEYNGYKFRSRLEARWAVFFDEIGIKYEYEKEGFELDKNIRYLPDFYLPKQEIYFEIKGEHPNDLEMKKAYMLSCKLKRPVIIAIGQFKIDLHYFSYQEFIFFGGEGYDIFNSNYFFMENMRLNKDNLYQMLIDNRYIENMRYEDTQEFRKIMIDLDKKYYFNKFNSEHPHWKYGRHENKRWDKFMMNFFKDQSYAIHYKENYIDLIISAMVEAQQARFEFKTNK